MRIQPIFIFKTRQTTGVDKLPSNSLILILDDENNQPQLYGAKNIKMYNFDESSTVEDLFGIPGLMNPIGGLSDISFEDISDIDCSTPPTDGQLLKYDGSKWKPSDSVFNMNNLFTIDTDITVDASNTEEITLIDFPTEETPIMMVEIQITVNETDHYSFKLKDIENTHYESVYLEGSFRDNSTLFFIVKDKLIFEIYNSNDTDQINVNVKFTYFTFN